MGWASGAEERGPLLVSVGLTVPRSPRFADQRGARAAFTLNFLASSAFYLLLAAACSPALPGVALLYALPLPAALMQGLPGRAK